ncbi:uncharacterized protein N0V89_004923 [Didymosphaeria variabile]|uniref:FAD/NAD(P)-binding domain-containing protein n=1 Tax=Didymosphaeria variabile TaxID=1932322 RepID=A0A9W9CAQ6_9PLEO|nr:uncharacterized protein N0V89_004923 [Didymosphaeria variabile]KAJ4353197.1 hypothetical protein N0V89_004923 [Didymosphaeria variabile]
MDGTKKEAVIVGGSLSGLMNAIVLRREGYKVQVLERSHPSKLISEAAGLGVGPNVHTFMETYVKRPDDYGIVLTDIEIWDENAQLSAKVPLPYTMRMTNWRTMYDMLKNALLDDDPDLAAAVYKTHVEVTDVREENAGVSVSYRDLGTGSEGVLRADLVIAADGANSSIRRKVWQPESPAYAGYSLWRGRISDQLVSEETKEALQGKTVIQKLRNGYMLSYFVPAELTEGKQDPRHRFDLFWAFYDILAEDSPRFQQTMTDTDGKLHRNAIPSGKIQPQVWQEASSRVKEQACWFYAELMDKSHQLYVSAIRDFPNTKAVFCDGKVILAGDAMSQCRPHAGGATNEHAFQAMELAKVLRGESTLEEWEKLCLDSAAKARALAIATGKRFLPEGAIADS